MQLLVGLGNPGMRYKKTRHNLGFMYLDYLASELGVAFSFDKKFNADVAKTSDLLLIKPLTYMNKSGESVVKVMKYFDIEYSDVVVIHDDIAFGVGEFKLNSGSGSGSHNGVQDIINRLKTKDFMRLRFGIGNDSKILLEDYVLTKFTKKELETLSESFKTIELSTLIGG